MQTLSKINTGSYVGGFCLFYYTPIQNIASIAAPNPQTKYLEAEPVLVAGKNWYGPISINKNALGFQESGDNTPQGLLFKTKVNGFQGGSIASQWVMLTQMLQYKYCLVAKLRSGGFWLLIGNQAIGCSFGYDYSAPSGNNSTGTQFTFALESALNAQVLTSFSGSSSQLPPDISGIAEGGNISVAKPETIAFNTGGDTVITWTTDRKTKYGLFPTIEVWAADGSNYYLATMPIDAIGNPPTQFIVRNNGGNGYIKIS